jgi:hypothetical protein
MTYPRTAIDPAVLQRLYERKLRLRKVATALQGIGMADRAGAVLRRAGEPLDPWAA